MTGKGRNYKNLQKPGNAATNAVPEENEIETLSEEGQQILKIILARVTSTLHIEIEKRDQRIASLEQNLKSQQEEIGLLKNKLTIQEGRKEEVDQLQNKVTCQEERIEFMLQDRHRETLVMTGNLPNHRANENCNSIIQETLRTKLNINVNMENIRGAARIGAPKPPGEADKRPIRFQLHPSMRKDLIQSCISTRPDIYINEYLTKYKNELFHKVRTAKRSLPEIIKKCYVSDGAIVIKKADATSIKIRTNSELENFLAKVNIVPVLGTSDRNN